MLQPIAQCGCGLWVLADWQQRPSCATQTRSCNSTPGSCQSCLAGCKTCISSPLQVSQPYSVDTDVLSSSLLPEIAWADTQVINLAWDAATDTLATSCLDNICRLWRKSGTDWSCCAELRSASGRFTCMCFPPTDSHLVTGAHAENLPPRCGPHCNCTGGEAQNGTLSIGLHMQDQLRALCRSGASALEPFQSACKVRTTVWGMLMSRIPQRQQCFVMRR